MGSSSKGKSRDLGVDDGPKRLDKLPAETLRHVIGYVDANDLLSIQTLSKQFLHLANAEIYRDLAFNITSAETDDRGDVASRAADALQTINTSEYDYAQYIKTFRLGGGEHIPASISLNYSDPHVLTRVVFDSKSDASKLLNTAVLQMLRKASILECFKWDLPMELSGTVYQALHKISSLRHLKIRLDVTPAPRLVSRSTYPVSHPPPPPPGIGQPPVPPNPSNLLVPAANKTPPRPYIKRKKAGGSTFWANQRSFSGFKFLSTLELPRLANLDSLPEMSQCIRACSASLKSLTVTLDQQFAVGPRRTPSTAQPNDIDDLSDTELEEDEMLFGNVFPNGIPQQSTDVDIRQVKTAQEGILAALFDLESSASKGTRLEAKLGLQGGRCLIEEDRSAQDTKLQDLMKTLNEEENADGKPKLSESARLEKYRMIRELANLYIQKNVPLLKKPSKTENKKTLPPKKSHKNPKANVGPKYPPVTSTEILDQFGLDDFLDPQNILNPHKPWLGSSQSKAYGSPFLYDPSLGGFNPNVSSLLGNPQLDPIPPLPYSTHLDAPGSGKAQSYTDSYMPSHSSPYTNASVKAYAKHLSNKKKSAKKAPGMFSPAHVHDVEYDTSGLYPYGKPAKKISLQQAQINELMADPTLSEDHYDTLNSAKNNLKQIEESSSTTSSGTEDDQKSEHKEPFFAAQSNQESNEGVDVDMEHPDEDDLDFDDQQSRSSTDTEIRSPRKRIKALEVGESSKAMTNGDSSDALPSQSISAVKLTNTEKMHDYVRTTHGIQLEELRLQYIPMKASILGKALDLTVLQRITLLETGPQDAFWALLVKLTSSEAPIAFKSIHTDNVSLSFLKYLSTFKGLEDLFMHQRKSKNDNDADVPVDIASIRKQALRPHVPTLKRVMLRNEANDAWDIENKTLSLLALQANHLEELAVNLKSTVYHSLLQIFPVFRSLRALHLIVLRGSDRANYFMQMESLAYTIDSLAHCPDLNIRFIAIGDNVMQLSGHKQFRNQLRKLIDDRTVAPEPQVSDKKGKGKAVDPGPMDVDEGSDIDSDDKLGNIQLPQKWSGIRIARKLNDIKGIKVFSLEHRTGKL